MFFENIHTLVVRTYAEEVLTRGSTSKFRERVRSQMEFITFSPLMELNFCHNIFLLRKSTQTSNKICTSQLYVISTTYNCHYCVINHYRYLANGFKVT